MYEILITKHTQLIKDLSYQLANPTDDYDLGHIQGEITSLALCLSIMEGIYEDD